MSASEDTRAPQGLKLEVVVFIGVCVLALGLVWYLMSQRQQELRSSPAGLDGLQTWLSAEDVPVQSFAGGWLIDEATVGLLVVPVYDSALDVPRVHPKTTEELLFQEDEYDLYLEGILEKAVQAQTLLVMPKWRSGMRLTGIAHPVLLVDPGAVEGTLRLVTGIERARLRPATAPFTEFDYPAKGGGTLKAKIYAAQTFDAPGCTPVIGRPGRILLGDCPVAEDEEARILVLADPDLLNNHGLRLGQNAEIARDFMAARAGGETRVLIDYSPYSWLIEAGANIGRERTWDDLMKFFGPPFLVLWLGVALLLAMTLWRAALRYGPVRDALSGPGAAKSQAIAAHARLMRLTDQDGPMVADYAAARVAAVAAALFGPALARQLGNEEAFRRFVRRRHPRHADRLDRVLTEIHCLPARISATEAIRHVDQLEDVLEAIADDT